MPRRPDFEPVETSKGWMVSVPPSMAADGKRVRRFFPEWKKAAAFAGSLRATHHAGLRGGLITAALALEAAEAVRILAGTGISLVEAARMAAVKTAAAGASELFRHRYLRAMRVGEMEWSDPYRDRMDKIPRFAPALMGMPCGAINREVIEAAILEGGTVSRSTLDVRIRWVTSILNYRERHKRTAEIVILTEEECAALLAACGTREERWTVALLLYAGIRPDAEHGEISRLEWSAVGASEIYISPGGSKTGSDRHIKIRPVLKRLLKGHPKSGDVKPRDWKRRWTVIRKAAGVTAPDSLRHTCASHHLAAFGEDETKQMLGHAAGSSTLFRFYRRAVTKEEGERFFR